MSGGSGDGDIQSHATAVQVLDGHIGVILQVLATLEWRPANDSSGYRHSSLLRHRGRLQVGYRGSDIDLLRLDYRVGLGNGDILGACHRGRRAGSRNGGHCDRLVRSSDQQSAGRAGLTRDQTYDVVGITVMCRNELHA